ncbi:MAG: alanine dehydrogenase [Ignavibacteriaceae bacterium]
MIIGIPKENHAGELRIVLAPPGIDSLVRSGHTVYMQSGAGLGSHFNDDDYIKTGATIVGNIKEVYQRSDLIVKVTSINDEEADLLKQHQILFSSLHFAVGKKETIIKLMKKKVTAIGYELIEEDGYLPILHSMSEIAGPLSIQIAERYLESFNAGGRGILLGGIPGVTSAVVLILGAGVVGTTAAKAAIGRGAQVIVIDRNLTRLRKIDSLFKKRVTTVMANPYTITRRIKIADVLIGAVLIKGEKTPHLVSEEMVKGMKKGSVIIDVSIDQGGCIETSRPTTLNDPIYKVHDVIHYCVPNMPALVSRTASYGLNNASLPYIQNIANNGIVNALMGSAALSRGVCTYQGFCSNEAIANIFNLEHRKLRIFSTN